MDVKIIKNQDDYEEALQKLVKLMDRNPIPGSDEENSLELLLLVIRDYEQKVIEPITVDPIEAIQFRMEQMDLSRKEMIPFFGSISKVSEVLSRKRNLSLTMIGYNKYQTTLADLDRYFHSYTYAAQLERYQLRQKTAASSS